MDIMATISRNNRCHDRFHVEKMYRKYYSKMSKYTIKCILTWRYEILSIKVFVLENWESKSMRIRSIFIIDAEQLNNRPSPQSYVAGWTNASDVVREHVSKERVMENVSNRASLQLKNESNLPLVRAVSCWTSHPSSSADHFSLCLTQIFELCSMTHQLLSDFILKHQDYPHCLHSLKQTLFCSTLMCLNI